MLTLPTKRVIQRPIDAALLAAAQNAGLTDAAARIVAGRATQVGMVPAVLDQTIISPTLKTLDPPDLLPDIQKAAERLALAIMGGEVIGLVSDYDCDGVSGHATAREVLCTHFNVDQARIRSYIGHRLKNGYGLSTGVATRILEDKPRASLAITIDHGSSDWQGIASLAAAGIDVVITDHHGIPDEGTPPQAFACVNPARKDSLFPDSCIAGCVVVWYLLCKTRQLLITYGYLDADAPSLSSVTDFLTIGTIADCVSMARSKNNRAIVRAGLSLIGERRRPCWTAAAGWLSDAGMKPVSSQDISFSIGPRLNAAGRLAEATIGLDFLLAASDRDALHLADALDQTNLKRREIEKGLTETAFLQGSEQYAAGRKSIVVWMPDGHPGVHGIVASRLMQSFGCPVACLSPVYQDTKRVTGSIRGIPGGHIRDALQVVDTAAPGLMGHFGGHPRAGGFTLNDRRDIQTFSEHFEEAISHQLGGEQPTPLLWTDGLLVGTPSLDLVRVLSKLEPVGIEFEAPTFEGAFTVRSLKVIGVDGTHLKLTLEQGGAVYDAVWFKVRRNAEEPLPVSQGDHCNFVFSMDDNCWNGEHNLQLRIEHKF